MSDIKKLLSGLDVSAGGNVVPFGKYKGQPMEVLRTDPEYTQWALDNGVISETKYRNVYIFLTGQQGESHDTPEHNRYQVLFLEPLFAGDVFDELFPGRRELSAVSERQTRLKCMRADAESRVSDWKSRRFMCSSPAEHAAEVAKAEADLADVPRQLEILRASPVEVDEVEVEFEVSDVVDGYGNRIRDHRSGKVMQYGGPADVQLRCLGERVRIEIKPSMGDDYPAVLRQMKASRCNVLYLGSYNGSGATLDQVKKLFQMSGIVVMEHDLPLVLA